MHPRVLMAVTTSLRSWNDYNAFEQMQRHFPKIGVSIVLTIGLIAFVHLTCISGRFVYSCSQPFHFGLLFPRTSDGQPFFIRLYRTEF